MIIFSILLVIALIVIFTHSKQDICGEPYEDKTVEEEPPTLD